MAIQHWQSHCSTCKRATLHIRNTYDVPHVLHLLISVVLCGLWLPVWIIHTLIDALDPASLGGARIAARPAGCLTATPSVPGPASQPCARL
jgi:hypothetical protein